MKRLLAVDDNPTVLETLVEALAIKGYEVLTAENAEGALNLLRNQAFDLVLLDYQMPGKSGFEVYRELGAIQEVPVLFVSGFSRSFSPATPGFADLWTGQFSDGRTDILYKPFTLAALFEKVEALIGDGVAADGTR